MHSRGVALCTAEVTALRAAAGNILLHVHKAGKVLPPPELRMQLQTQLRIPGGLYVLLVLRLNDATKVCAELLHLIMSYLQKGLRSPSALLTSALLTSAQRRLPNFADTTWA